MPSNGPGAYNVAYEENQQARQIFESSVRSLMSISTACRQIGSTEKANAAFTLAIAPRLP